MVSPTNQARKTNDFFFQLQSFSEAAHAFLKDPQEQDWGNWSRKTLLIALKNTLLSLELLNIDELPSEENELKFFSEVLDNFLSQSTSESLASTVPTEKLEKLKKDLEQQNLENKEYLAKVQEENEKQFAHLRRIAEIKKELVAALEKQNQAIAEPQAETLASEINENLELGPLRETLKRVATAETGSPLKESAWQEINQEYQEAIEQIPNLSPQVKEYLLNHRLSLKTAQNLIDSSQTQEKQVILKKAISPLTEAQKQAVEDLATAAAVNLASLDPKTSAEEIRAVIGFSLGQELSELASQQLSPEKVSALAQILQKESSRLIDGNLPPLPGLTPEIVTTKQRLFVSVTTPVLPGSQTGSIPQIVIEGELTPVEKTFETIKSGSFDQVRLELIGEEIGLAQTYHLTRQGQNIDATDKISQKEEVKNQLTSQKIAQFQYLKNNWIQFQAKFPFLIAQARVWSLNRLKFFRTFSRLPSPIQVYSQKALNWFYKTGVGQGLKSLSTRLAQKGLQSILSSAKVGAKRAITRGITSLLTKVGLQAFANTLAPLVGGLIALAGEAAIKTGSSWIRKGIGFITSGFGLANAFFAGLGGRAEPKENLTGKLAFVGGITVAALAALTFITNIQVKEGGLLGLGRGSPLGPSGHVEGDPPQCQPSRHFAEKVICNLSGGVSPCNHERINQSTWPIVNDCFAIANFEHKEIVRDIFEASVNSYNSLQCVGFVYAIQSALGYGLDKFLPRESACDYAYGNPPTNYKYVHWDEPIKEGDLAVWDGAACGTNNGFRFGHIAIVIEEDKISNSKLVIAEALGDLEGERGDIIIHTIVNTGAPDNPKIYLRYSP